MIKLEDDVPIPPSGSAERGRPATYPFAEMRIGQSFAIPVEMKNRLGNAAVKWKQRHPGWDYKTVISEGRIRLWRIS